MTSLCQATTPASDWSVGGVGEVRGAGASRWRPTTACAGGEKAARSAVPRVMMLPARYRPRGPACTRGRGSPRGRWCTGVIMVPPRLAGAPASVRSAAGGPARSAAPRVIMVPPRFAGAYAAAEVPAEAAAFSLYSLKKASLERLASNSTTRRSPFCNWPLAMRLDTGCTTIRSTARFRWRAP
jgi:hypothetical protein